jgi:dipeptidase E
MEVPHLVLGSMELRGAVAPLGLRRALFVPTAANGLDDRDAIVHSYRSQLEDVGVEVVDWDIEERGAGDDLPEVDAICVSGGDPYRLLDACRASGFDRSVAALVDGGLPYIGASAGAMVAGPSLDPIEDVSPFARPHGFDGAALGLTDRLVLPHDDRPGRRAAHAAAQSRHGARHRLLAITDDETVSIRADRWELTDHARGQRFRPAVVGDAAAIADCFLAAGRAAWRFLDADRLEAMPPPVRAWVERLRALPDPDDLVVVGDGEGLGGFVWVRRSPDADLGDGVGEVGAFYTHPRLWGRGAGRRLLTLGLDRLRARGCHTAVLYTEERNDRPRRLYERLGWRTDGAARTRDFLGLPLREVRYRLAL